jgi:inner membrane protein
MSSYKGHTVFAVMLSFLMFYNPLAISLAILGANFPDFDHEFKQNQVLTILALGIITVCFLYFLNLPIYLGLILILLSLIFLFSSHRGFTHSIMGVLIQGVLIFLLIFCALDLAMSFNPQSNINIPINLLLAFILLAVLGIFFLNKKVAILNTVFIISSIFLLYFGVLPIFKLDVHMVVFSIYLGLFSHLILDSFTPSGIRIFSPFIKNEYHKKAGILIFALLLASYFILFSQYLPFYKFF